MRLLMTGFDSFGTVVNNPTERIIKHIKNLSLNNIELITAILPVSFVRAADEIEKLIIDNKPDAAILLGVAGNRKCFSLEQSGKNYADAFIPDCDGFQPCEIVLDNSEISQIETKITLNGILESLIAKEHNVEISNDAGGYVCNAVYYKALRVIKDNHIQCDCLFFHVPPDKSTFSEYNIALPSIELHYDAVVCLINLINTERALQEKTR